MLQVRDGKIINDDKRSIRLRGTCIGGWMNMENFITGYPGHESGLREAAAEALGADLAGRLFDSLLDNFLAEADFAFLRKCGINVVRIPLNYRHFESDTEPFTYLPGGFARLDKALELCRKHGIYAILDLHAVQGWQNPDWHCDNPWPQALFWQQKQFQDRFVALWEELARRYAGNEIVAGYNVMNEPVTRPTRRRWTGGYRTDWDTFNHVYRRVVAAIRAIDPNHIIFLEGDLYSTVFDGLDEPFAENLAYSSHNYTPAGHGPGRYPGIIGGSMWDRERQARELTQSQGYQFARKHNVPLWAGEFGSAYVGPVEENADRIRAIDDQISVFEEHDVHWTTWTYKDVGVMGLAMVDPKSPYLETIAAVQQSKRRIGVDQWLSHFEPQSIQQAVDDVADQVFEAVKDDDLNRDENRYAVRQLMTSCHAAALLQPCWARCFAGMAAEQIAEIMRSFAFERCRINEPLAEVLRKHTGGQA